MKRGELLSDKRIEKGLSVSALAQKLGVSAAEVERWEAGELPESGHLLALSALLDISVEDILRGGEDADEAGALEGPSGGAQGSREEDASDAAETQERETEAGEPSHRFDFGEVRREQRNGEPLDSDAFDDIRNDRAFVQVLAREEGESCNGYSSGERKFGYMLFAVFTVVAVIMLAVQFAGWVSRPRELTMENYREFLDIDVVPTKNFNPDEYIVRVTAKEVMTNLRITVRVTFWSFRGNEFSETVTVAAAVLSEGGTAGEPIHISEIALDRGFEVLSVEGDLE